jgi:hypothetical protein
LVSGLRVSLTLGGFNHGEAQPLQAENNENLVLRVVKTHNEFYPNPDEQMSQGVAR